MSVEAIRGMVRLANKITNLMRLPAKSSLGMPPAIATATEITAPATLLSLGIKLRISSIGKAEVSIAMIRILMVLITALHNHLSSEDPSML